MNSQERLILAYMIKEAVNWEELLRVAGKEHIGSGVGRKLMDALRDTGKPLGSFLNKRVSGSPELESAFSKLRPSSAAPYVAGEEMTHPTSRHGEAMSAMLSKLKGVDESMAAEKAKPNWTKGQRQGPLALAKQQVPAVRSRLPDDTATAETFRANRSDGSRGRNWTKGQRQGPLARVESPDVLDAEIVPDKKNWSLRDHLYGNRRNYAIGAGALGLGGVGDHELNQQSQPKPTMGMSDRLRAAYSILAGQH